MKAPFFSNKNLEILMKYSNKSFSFINGEKLYQGLFKPKAGNININNEDLVFAFIGSEVILIDDKIPNYSLFKKENIKYSFLKYVGNIESNPCFALSINHVNENSTNIKQINLRDAFHVLSDDHLRAAIYAHQVLLWNTRTQYCGVCGTKTFEPESNDWVKECPKCNEKFFPKVSPAIIVAISNKGKLLMAHHKRMASGIFTILAGFVNPGESLEECIHREVMEEAGIKIKNIQYFGSQPWPFPDSLMIGFKAEYKSGELNPDLEELTEVNWFKPDEIPEWESRSSIARALIDDFIRNNK